MEATEVNRSYDKQRQLKRDRPPPESTYHKFMMVLTNYIVPTLSFREKSAIIPNYCVD